MYGIIIHVVAMTNNWQIPLNLRCKESPVVILVIRSWNPFEYSATLRVTIRSISHDITRIDNIGKQDHRDQFFLDSKPIKHLPVPFGTTTNLKELEWVITYLERNWQNLLSNFMRGE